MDIMSCQCCGSHKENHLNPVASKLVPLLKRFQKDKTYFEMYRKNIDDYVKNDYAKCDRG